MGGAGRSQRAAGGDLQRPSAAAVVTNVNASHRRRRHLRCATVVDARIVGVGGHAVVPVPGRGPVAGAAGPVRSEEHTSELQSLMRISYAVFCLKKKKTKKYKRRIQKYTTTKKKNK